MMEIKGIRTLAINARNLAQAEDFYTKLLGATVGRRIDPTAEQLEQGRAKEIDVQLGNFQVHLFDASEKPRSGVPHHTLSVAWKEKTQAVRELEQSGAKIDSIRDHHDGKGYSLYLRDPDGNIWELSVTL